MADALIQVVDEHNQPLRAGTKQEVWQNGLWHRVAHVTVFSLDGKILIQKRAATKKPFPGCWDNSTSGHVDADESYEVAARRELTEELGVTASDLTEVGTFELHYESKDWGKINRFDRAYKITIAEDTEFNLPPDEVSEVEWVTIPYLKRRIADDPSEFTYPLTQIIKLFY